MLAVLKPKLDCTGEGFYVCILHQGSQSSERGGAGQMTIKNATTRVAQSQIMGGSLMQ